MVVAPPFAEELNRSRRMIAVQMAALAEQGIGSLVVDPYGTGDSAGDFAGARWDGWRADLETGLRWLAGRGRARIVVLGIRLGALMAAELARTAGLGVERLVLWQPVGSGEALITQVLRLRLAGDMAVAAEARTTTKELRARLAAGEVLEVAGYPLSAPLTQAIDRLRLAELPPPSGVRVDWVDVAPEPGASPSPASRGVIEAWEQAGSDVRHAVVGGEPFWSLQETTLAPALIAATTALLTERAP